MTQGWMQAYGASARPALDLETALLLHYILPLTLERLLRAPSTLFFFFFFYSVMLLFSANVHFSALSV